MPVDGWPGSAADDTTVRSNRFSRFGMHPFGRANAASNARGPEAAGRGSTWERPRLERKGFRGVPPRDRNCGPGCFLAEGMPEASTEGVPLNTVSAVSVRLQAFVLIGALDRIRTCDLPLRRRLLYPAELRGHWGCDGNVPAAVRPSTMPVAGVTKPVHALTLHGLAEWQSGYAAACKAVDAGSIPTSASRSPICRRAEKQRASVIGA